MDVVSTHREVTLAININTMILNILPFLLVTTGIIMLSFSVYSTQKISQEDPGRKDLWNILLFLNVFFIAGYIMAGYMLLTDTVTLNEFIVSLILFGGGVFFMLTVRMNYHSIQNEKQKVDMERHRGMHDDLTDLPNRKYLYEKIGHAILNAKRNKSTVAILLMDLDQFKEINDTLGHHYGDRLLQQIAPRLKMLIHDTDTVARIGGDEFTIILNGQSAFEAIEFAKIIEKSVHEPFDIDGYKLNIGISIGISIYPENGINTRTLLKCADVAMYVAKYSDLSYSVYDPAQDKHTVNRLKLMGELHDVLNKRQLDLHYQPIISIKDGHVCGVEALTRWNHPKHGIILPDEFIPLIESAALIKPLTLWVLESALKDHISWKAMGIDMPVSINVSIKNLNDESFTGQVESLLKSCEIDPSILTFEITESSMMDDKKRTFEMITKLHDLGIHISIDDFGTGYASLAYIKQLPTDEIKIDKSFVMDMLDDDNDGIIVRSTIDLAHNMGLRVTAEGIHNKDVLDLLEILGCDMGQGFYICPPLPAEEITGWIGSINQQASGH